jgi:hypothetical protein
MASTYSALKIELIGTGEQSGTWGTTTNNNLTDTALGEAITGSADVAFSSADVTVTLTDTNSSQTARNLRLNLTGTTGGARSLILGSGCQIEKLYLVNNTCADAITVKNTTGTGIAVAAGKSTFVFNNGTNVVDAVTQFNGTIALATGVSGVLPIANGGTGSSSTTYASLTANVTGTLPLANGGTNSTTAPQANATLRGWTTTATASGTTTLTSASSHQQEFTGTLAQTVVLPVTSTLALGWSYEIINNSTGSLTIQSSGANTIGTITGGTTASLVCTLTSGTTAASWDFDVDGFATQTGTGAVVLATSPSLTTPTLNNSTVTNYVESVVAIGTVTTTNTIALTNGTVQTATLTASTACTFTMPTATAGKSFILLLKQAATTGNGTATFTGVKWGTAGAPTITATAGKMDILTFVADGTNWYGSAAQGYTP